MLQGRLVTLPGNFQSPDISVSVFPSVSKLTPGIPKTKLRYFYGVQSPGFLLAHLGLAIGDFRGKPAKRKQDYYQKEPGAIKHQK